MRVVLSIKPAYAAKIFDGSKRYEFRKTIFKNPAVKTVVVYASSPIQQVIGEFDIETIIHSEKHALWQTTKEFSGISKEFFFDYFENKTNGYAIKIKKTRKYKKPKSLKSDFHLLPPQSFVYIA
jgi:predicted transcriptional regulator